MSFDTAVTIVFIASAALLAYVYVGFPALVAVWGTLRRRDVRKGDITPTVSLIVAAYNEEACVADKLENCLALDYPRDRLEILLASDGSTDGTADLAAEFAARGVHVLRLGRGGKLRALDQAIRVSSGSILVFSDANTSLDPQALRALARNFADPAVGGVCGNLRVRRRARDDASASGESWYWELDKRLKALQSRCGSIVAADGAIYAIRRELYGLPAHAAVTDDFAISTGVIERGARLVFEPDAIAYESSAGRTNLEFGRKVRIVNRGLRGVLLRRRLLDPRRYGFYAVVLFSHKVLRRIAAFALVTLLASTALLAFGHPLFAALLIAQAAFYAAALTGWFLRRRSCGHHKLLLAPFYYCLANAAAVVGVCTLLAGRRIERWTTQRQELAS